MLSDQDRSNRSRTEGPGKHVWLQENQPIASTRLLSSSFPKPPQPGRLQVAFGVCARATSLGTRQRQGNWSTHNPKVLIQSLLRFTFRTSLICCMVREGGKVHEMGAGMVPIQSPCAPFLLNFSHPFLSEQPLGFISRHPVASLGAKGFSSSERKLPRSPN